MMLFLLFACGSDPSAQKVKDSGTPPIEGTDTVTDSDADTGGSGDTDSATSDTAEIGYSTARHGNTIPCP